MYYADNLLDRFRHVDALASRGVGGERENAARILRDMESKYPGIRAQAYPRTATNDAPNLDAFTAAGGNFGGAASAPKPEKPSSDPQWARWKNVASDALGWATRMAAEMAAAKEVESVVERLVEVQSKNLTSGNFQISVKFPAEEMGFHLARMSPVQHAQFIDRLTTLFRDELTYALTPDEDE